MQKSPDIQNLKNSGECDTIILRVIVSSAPCVGDSALFEDQSSRAFFIFFVKCNGHLVLDEMPLLNTVCAFKHCHLMASYQQYNILYAVRQELFFSKVYNFFSFSFISSKSEAESLTLYRLFVFLIGLTIRFLLIVVI